MRFALPLLAALAMVTLVGCGGDDDAETADPTPLTQRFLTAEDAPGSKPDPVEERQTTEDFDEFITGLSDASIDPDRDEMTTVFQDAGFNGAGVDTRFFGETHTPGSSPHVISSFIELESEDGATSALDWLETDAKKPCPMSCAVQISEFDVDDIPDARGVHRIATAEDIERVGTEDERPNDSYFVGFTNGAFVYTVDLFGPPGSVSEEQALEIASAYYERLAGNYAASRYLLIMITRMKITAPNRSTDERTIPVKNAPLRAARVDLPVTRKHNARLTGLLRHRVSGRVSPRRGHDRHRGRPAHCGRAGRA